MVGFLPADKELQQLGELNGVADIQGNDWRYVASRRAGESGLSGCCPWAGCTGPRRRQGPMIWPWAASSAWQGWAVSSAV